MLGMDGRCEGEVRQVLKWVGVEAREVGIMDFLVRSVSYSSPWVNVLHSGKY